MGQCCRVSEVQEKQQQQHTVLQAQARYVVCRPAGMPALQMHHEAYAGKGEHAEQKCFYAAAEGERVIDSDSHRVGI